MPGWHQMEAAQALPVSSGIKAQTEMGREQREYRGSDSFFQDFLGRKRVGGRGSGKAHRRGDIWTGCGCCTSENQPPVASQASACPLQEAETVFWERGAHRVGAISRKENQQTPVLWEMLRDFIGAHVWPCFCRYPLTCGDWHSLRWVLGWEGMTGQYQDHEWFTGRSIYVRHCAPALKEKGVTAPSPPIPSTGREEDTTMSYLGPHKWGDTLGMAKQVTLEQSH